MRDLTIVLNGVSKSHAMTGWRIGFLCAPAELSTEMLKVHQYLATCATSISQYAALEAMQHGQDDALEMRTAYRQRRDFMVTALRDMGLTLTEPEGAFYLFPSIAHTNLTSLEFSQRLLEEARVAVVPGDAFSTCGEGFIRVSYAVSEEQLQEAVLRMRAWL
jgi:aminotransferase